METFGEQAQEWAQFFSAVAQVSGGLVGLVFVALTFNGKLATSDNPALGLLARQTFADFLTVLVVSLLLLVPHMLATNVGIIILPFGGAGIVRILQALTGIIRRRSKHASGKELLQRFLLSLLGNLGLLMAGTTLLSGGSLATFWLTLLGSIMGLLVSGARSAWMLVLPDPDDTVR